MRITLLSIFLLFFINSFAQKAQTIQELLLQPKDCNYLLMENIAEEDDEQSIEPDKKASTKSKRPSPPPTPPQPDDIPIQTSPTPAPIINSNDKVDYVQNIKTHFANLASSKEIKNGSNTFFQDKNLKWGMRNNAGAIMIPADFDYIKSDAEWEGFISLKNGKFNFYDFQGSAQFKEGFYYLEYVNSNLFIFGDGSGIGLILADGEILVKPRFKSLHPINSNGKTFFIGTNEQDYMTVISPKAEIIELNLPFKKGEIYEERYLYTSGKIIDLETGQSLICDDAFYIELMNKEKGWFGVYRRRNKAMNIINVKGELIIEKTFSHRFKFSDIKGLAVVREKAFKENQYGRKDYLQGIMNKDFEWVLEPSYFGLRNAGKYPYYIAIQMNQIKGLIDTANNIIIPIKYRNLFVLNNFVLGTDHRTDPLVSDLYDLKTGKLIKQNQGIAIIKSFEVCEQSHLFYSYERDGRKTILTEELDVILEDIFHEYFPFGEEGFFTGEHLSTSSKYKIYSCDGTPKTLKIGKKKQTEFQKIEHLNDHEYLVTLLDNRAYIYNLTTKESQFIGENIISLKPIEKLQLYIAKSSTTKKYGLISKNGTILLQTIYDRIEAPKNENDLIRFYSRNQSSGAITNQGDLLFLEYKSPYHLGCHLFSVRSNGHTGVVDIHGKVVIPFEYNAIMKRHHFIEACTREKCDQYSWSGELLDSRSMKR